MENHLTKNSPTPNSKKTPNIVNKWSAMVDKIHAPLMYVKFSRFHRNVEGGSKNLIKSLKNGEREREHGPFETIKTNRTPKCKQNR